MIGRTAWDVEPLRDWHRVIMVSLPRGLFATQDLFGGPDPDEVRNGNSAEIKATYFPNLGLL